MLEGEQKTIARSVKKKRRAPTVASQKKKLLVLSAVSALSVIIISFIISSVVGNTTIRDMGAVAGIIAGVMPTVTVNMRQVHRKGSIDTNLPIFLLGLRSSVVSGHSIIQGLETTADRNMGALTPELKNLRANLSWGMPVEESFENFANRTGTKTARRVAVLLEMALKIGGDIRTNLEMIQKHVTELQNLEKERKSSLAPYTYTIYISFAVFLGIAVILSSQFFSEFAVVQKLLEKSPGAGGGEFFSSITNMDIEALNTVLFNMSIIEAIFGGLAAGKIGSGNYVAGIKHIIVMIVMAVVAFMFI